MIAADGDGHQRTSMDYVQHLKAKIRKHERQIAFHDTEAIPRPAHCRIGPKFYKPRGAGAGPPSGQVAEG
jgi:hypothetical protein